MLRINLVTIVTIAIAVANCGLSSSFAQSAPGSSEPRQDRPVARSSGSSASAAGQQPARSDDSRNSSWRVFDQNPASADLFGRPGKSAATTRELLLEDNGKFSIESSDKHDEEAYTKNASAWKKIHDAASVLQADSSSSENIASAKKTIAAYLSAQFDHDQKKRQEQVKKLEEQVSKLKSQLQKREQSKEQMIELRLTLLLNDANGLSFPNAWNSLGDEGSSNMPARRNRSNQNFNNDPFGSNVPGPDLFGPDSFGDDPFK